MCGMVFISVLICATFIDLDHFIIPDAFTIGGALGGLLLSMLVPALHSQSGDIFIVESLRSGVIALQGLLIGSGLVLWIGLVAEALLKKEAMGFGDVKFIGMIGAFCGWQGTIFSLFGGAVVGTVWFVLAFVWQKFFPSQKTALPAESPGRRRPARLASASECTCPSDPMRSPSPPRSIFYGCIPGWMRTSTMAEISALL